MHVTIRLMCVEYALESDVGERGLPNDVRAHHVVVTQCGAEVGRHVEAAGEEVCAGDGLAGDDVVCARVEGHSGVSQASAAQPRERATCQPVRPHDQEKQHLVRRAPRTLQCRSTSSHTLTHGTTSFNPSSSISTPISLMKSRTRFTGRSLGSPRTNTLLPLIFGCSAHLASGSPLSGAAARSAAR